MLMKMKRRWRKDWRKDTGEVVPISYVVDDSWWSKIPQELSIRIPVDLRKHFLYAPVRTSNDYITLVKESARAPWSTHSKIVDSPFCEKVLATVARVFEIRVIETRINYYEDGQGKPPHQDRNAFAPSCGNLTLGVSLGGKRDMVLHRIGNTSDVVSVPQGNGDIFAFDDVANKAFLHSIKPGSMARVSLIIWGDGDLDIIRSKIKNGVVNEDVLFG